MQQTATVIAPVIQRCACGDARAAQRRGEIRACADCGWLLAAHAPLPDASDAGEPPLPLGTLLRERYRLLRVLGRGAHGFAILAEHEFLKLPCVVKLLPNRVGDASEAAVRRLRAEAAAGFRVNDPHVVRVLDFDAIDGWWYFVMEFVAGIDLARVAAQGARLPWAQAQALAVQACQGLAAIHDLRLVHRDIKPANLLLADSGRFRVTDFGIVGLLDDASFEQDDAAAPIGTFPYAAPELADGSAGPASDLYSLGVTLYELTCGRLPRDGSVYRSMMASQLDPITWPADVDVPEWYSAGVMRLMSPRPDGRFASAREAGDYFSQLSSVTRRVSGNAPPSSLGVALLPLAARDAESADDWLGIAVADHLARGVGESHGVHLVDREQFLATLGRFTAAGSSGTAADLARAAGLTGAGLVVYGEFERHGGDVAFVLRALQADDAAVREVARAAGPLAQLARLEEMLARGLAQLLPGARLTSARPAEPLVVQEAFFQGKRVFLRGDYAAALQLFERALALDAEYAEALSHSGVCCARMGRYTDALQFNQRLQELAERRGEARLRIEAAANLATMNYFQGAYAQARSHFERAAREAEVGGFATELAQIRNNLGFVHLQLGETAEAERSFRAAIEVHTAHGALVWLIGPYNGLGHVLRELGRAEEAREYFQKALGLAQAAGDRVNMGVAYTNLAHVDLALQRPEDAQNELALALSLLEETSFWNGLSRVYEYMAELNLQRGQAAEALRCAGRRIELCRRHANAKLEAQAFRQQAAAYRMAGATRDAECSLERAAALDGRNAN